MTVFHWTIAVQYVYKQACPDTYVLTTRRTQCQRGFHLLNSVFQTKCCMSPSSGQIWNEIQCVCSVLEHSQRDRERQKEKLNVSRFFSFMVSVTLSEVCCHGCTSRTTRPQLTPDLYFNVVVNRTCMCSMLCMTEMEGFRGKVWEMNSVCVCVYVGGCLWQVSSCSCYSAAVNLSRSLSPPHTHKQQTTFKCKYRQTHTSAPGNVDTAN